MPFSMSAGEEGRVLAHYFLKLPYKRDWHRDTVAFGRQHRANTVLSHMS
jgi:hypothetical protein